MTAKLKANKFKRDAIRGLIRSEVLSSGKIIAFCITGIDLSSTLPFGSDVDFDKESDELIVKNQGSKDHLAFQYIPNIGFDEVDIKKQDWFYF